MANTGDRLLAFAVLLFATACTPQADWSEGGLYAVQEETGTYLVFKVLNVDEGSVHLRGYNNRFDSLRESIDESSLRTGGDYLPVLRHNAISLEKFSRARPVFIQQSTVTPDEMEDIERWRETGGGYD